MQKTFVVFGAGSDIGQVLIKELTEKGHRVFGITRSIDAEKKERLRGCQLIEQTGLGFDDFSRSFENIGNDCIIDGVVNFMGSLLLKPAHLTSEREFLDTIDINLKSSFAIVGHAAKKMMKQKQGSIVLLSSAVAHIGLPNHEAIAAAKAGVIGLMKSAAATYCEKGIRVNTVSPGITETKLTQSILQNEIGRKASLAQLALKRIGEPDDIAQAVLWLLSDKSKWVTGQDIGVDGGLASIKPRVKV